MGTTPSGYLRTRPMTVSSRRWQTSGPIQQYHRQVFWGSWSAGTSYLRPTDDSARERKQRGSDYRMPALAARVLGSLPSCFGLAATQEFGAGGGDNDVAAGRFVGGIVSPPVCVSTASATHRLGHHASAR